MTRFEALKASTETNGEVMIRL